MDRAETLAALDGMVRSDGAVALCSDHHLRCRENRWVEALEEVRQRFERRDEFQASQKAGEVERHEIVLLASAFSRLESMGVTERRELTIETAVARALSYSASSPEKLGEQRQAFEVQAREALLPLATDGRLSEIVSFSALLARRP
jgi:hypothetical protein